MVMKNSSLHVTFLTFSSFHKASGYDEPVIAGSVMEMIYEVCFESAS